MGCPASCQVSGRQSSERFDDSDRVRATLENIDRRSAATLLRTRREVGVLVASALGLSGIVLSYGGPAPAARILGLSSVGVAVLWFWICDLLFHRTRAAIIEDVRERSIAAADLCPEVRNRLGFRMPVILTREIDLDVVWYSAAGCLFAACATAGLLVALDPGFVRLNGSPLDTVSTTVLIANFLWLAAIRRIARNQFQLTMEWACATTGSSERVFRTQLLHLVRKSRPRLEVRRSAFAGAAISVGLLGLLIYGHPGELLRPAFACALLVLDGVYAWLYWHYNLVAARVNVVSDTKCRFEGEQPVHCPLILHRPPPIRAVPEPNS